MTNKEMIQDLAEIKNELKELFDKTLRKKVLLNTDETTYYISTLLLLKKYRHATQLPGWEDISNFLKQAHDLLESMEPIQWGHYKFVDMKKVNINCDNILEMLKFVKKAIIKKETRMD
jgi:hypothetical protein